jgi:hypothetical protein
MTLPKASCDLLETPESQLPVLYFHKHKLEEAILDYRDLASQGKFSFTDIPDMGPIFKHTGSSKGLEIISFEDAEVQKSKDGLISNSISGPLSVLYFKDYRRFFLYIDGWFYPLMRRLPVVGMDKNNGSSSRLYCLPGPNGFWYNLRINCYGSVQGLENFESILQDCSRFSWKGEAYHGKREQSPDDKLARKTAIKEENVGKCNFTKDQLKSSEMLSEKFVNLRKSNLNMTLPKTFDELTRTLESQVLVLYFPKEDIEETIIEYRDVASEGKINMRDLTKLRPTFVESIKKEVREIKETLVGGIERARGSIVEGIDRRGILNENKMPQT